MRHFSDTPSDLRHTLRHIWGSNFAISSVAIPMSQFARTSCHGASAGCRQAPTHLDAITKIETLTAGEAFKGYAAARDHGRLRHQGIPILQLLDKDQPLVLRHGFAVAEQRRHVLLDRLAHVAPGPLDGAAVAEAAGQARAIRKVALVLRLLQDHDLETAGPRRGSGSPPWGCATPENVSTLDQAWLKRFSRALALSFHMAGEMTSIEEGTTEAAIASLLDSIAFNRLVVICGAGLSRAAPSQLPSAAQLARTCADTYHRLRGIRLDPPLDFDLEALANYFYDTGQLVDTFIRQLVPNDLTHAAPNVGHFAIADIIITKSCHFVISTNFDDLIESAVAQMGERGFYSSLDGMEAENEARHSVPLLKIHGCWRKQREYTIWTPRQLTTDVIRLRLDDLKRWLHAKIRNRDLLFLGFFTDWEYLNAVLRECLPEDEPRSVVVVDLTDLNVLRGKAVSLYQLLQNFAFIHVKEPAEIFLDRFRQEFSLMLLKRMLVEHGQ